VWGREGGRPLPVQEVTIRTVFGGLFLLGRPPRFERAAARSLDSAADLRWGPDGKGFTRFTHPTWRQDRNDPASATRINGMKVL